jgi:hypothetical protein
MSCGRIIINLRPRMMFGEKAREYGITIYKIYW